MILNFSAILSNKIAERFVIGLIFILCAIGNLPWHLDNYDQAKQAYVSYEIAQGGNWWFQHTPRGKTATKPPLAGWISLPIYTATGSWDLAWRLPGFVCTIVLLWLLMSEGRRILPEGGAFLAACAFGLNLLTPRIATLVRTDMMLTLWITLCGWLIYRKLYSGTPWKTSERWAFFAAMLVALFTKGPILYAFLLPGMVMYGIVAKSKSGFQPVTILSKPKASIIWSGLWTWGVPLILFLTWLGFGIVTNRPFYEDVVLQEFFSRFDQSLKSHEQQQPIWFYFPHLFHKFAPWSLLAVALPIFSKNVRSIFKSQPEALWLACWALGGLLCMTFIPSKRVDRIFPIVPPLCLLLVTMVSACNFGKVRAWCGAAIVASIFFSGGYFLAVIWSGYRDKSDVLVRFGEQVREEAKKAGVAEIGVVDSRDEGMLIYCEGKKYLRPDQAKKMFNRGELRAVVIPERRIKNIAAFPPPVLDSGAVTKNESRYLLFIREN